MDYSISQTDYKPIEPFTIRAGRERVIIFNPAGAVWFAAFITNQSDMIPIGCACCVIKGQEALFRGIFVEKSFRRQGVFRALFKEQLKYCKAHGVKELTANCTPLSLPEFLAKGFTKVGNYKNSKTITIVRYVI
jgi:GNAT superfamily N-acetyltransferase